MTKLLENGIDAVRDLPADQQNLAGEFLLSLAAQSKHPHRLTPEQVENAKLAVAEADSGDFATDEGMAAPTKAEIEAVLERVRTWPVERQEDAARILLEMEAQGTGVYELSAEELADIEEGMAEIRRGEFASDEEVAELFNRYRGR